jgi:CheY-like chemotaxis protein
VEALAMVQRHGQAINVVVTDVMMPEMDGVEMIRVLRKIHPRLKIIASSGLGTDRGGSLRSEELKALNVKSFLVKPYTVDKLLEALHGLLRNGNGACAVS